jgi:predicted dehydrogenase
VTIDRYLPAMHTLLFLEPGHFHAALTLRVANPRIDPAIHLYARPGPERDAFVALVRSFNARDDQPTDWKVRVHDSADPERALVEDRRGNIVILAGRTRPKLGAIARLHAAGLHVLADKPWLTDGAALPDLEQVTAGWPLAIDVMTSRHETVARLTQKIAADRELFGELHRQADEPAIDIQSLHHLLKVVNGAPLRRPPWYYDTRIQGDGLVDIQSHMVDQAQWLLGDGAGFEFERDFELEDAHRWDTPVPLDLFRASTGLDAFPRSLEPQVEAGVLHLACNGEIRYRLRGVPVRQRAEWGQREPDGGGDVHRTTVRGEHAVLTARNGPETGFRGELHIAPRDPGTGFEARLSELLATWEIEMPGLAHRASPLGHEIVIPAVLHTPHEAHFAMVLEDFLDRLDAGEWPAELAARIRARYVLLARAREHCVPGRLSP